MQELEVRADCLNARAICKDRSVECESQKQGLIKKNAKGLIECKSRRTDLIGTSRETPPTPLVKLVCDLAALPLNLLEMIAN